MAKNAESVDGVNEESAFLNKPVNYEDLVLWKKPMLTIDYFVAGTFETVYGYVRKILTIGKICVLIIAFICAYKISQSEGPHSEFMDVLEVLFGKLCWCAYWMNLGVMSSVSLGLGFHTFLLFLVPHIASVTLAAYECDSLAFPEPPYPEDPKQDSNPQLSINSGDLEHPGPLSYRHCGYQTCSNIVQCMVTGTLINTATFISHHFLCFCVEIQT